MQTRTRIDIESSAVGLDRLFEAFERFAEEHRIPEAARKDVALALDEVVSNVIRHGYGGEETHRIAVTLAVESGVLEVDVIDDARPFNMLEVEPAPVNEPLRERPIGGVGIRLVRQLMDELEYRREGALNRLVLKKRLVSGG